MHWNVDNTTICSLQRADDQVVMAQSKEDLYIYIYAGNSKNNTLNGVLL
jgi:hypothetical protein